MKKFKLSIITSCLIALYPISINADSMKDFAAGVIIKEKSPTGSAGYYSAGGYQLQFPNNTLQPLVVTPPSVKAGCGGIDLTFGSMQFLDIEKIVQFMQASLSNAAGVAFDLALKAACEECSETLKSLEAMANSINNMSLNSCQAAKSALDAVGLEQMLTVKNDGTNWVKTTAGEVTGFFNKTVKSWLNTAGFNSASFAKFLAPDQTDYNTYIDYLFKSNTAFDAVSKNFLRSVSGDIRVFMRPAGDKTGIVSMNMLLPEEIKKLVASKIGVIKESSDSGFFIYGSNWEKLNGGATLAEAYRFKVDNIVEAIQNREAPDAQDLTMLSGMNYPVYRIFNALSVTPETRAIIGMLSDEIANVIASEVAYEYLARYSYMLLQERTNWNNLSEQAQASFAYDIGVGGIKQLLDSMITNVNYGLESAIQSRYKAHEEFGKKLSNYGNSIEQSLKIKAFVLKSRNPDFYNNLVVAESFGGKN